MKTVFTKFKKSVKSGLGLSFSQSANHYCDKKCRLLKCCYAARSERIYKGLNAKLLRHFEMGASELVEYAIQQLPENFIPWFRFSVDGSLPKRSDLSAKNWRLFAIAMRKLVGVLLARNCPIHLPVESASKARSYRSMLPGIVVRRTSQVKTINALIKEDDHRSWVVAYRIHNACVTKQQTQANIVLAKKYAKRIRDSKQSVVVCPAISGNGKCGNCKACASPLVDIVLYPFHA